MKQLIINIKITSTELWDFLKTLFINTFSESNTLKLFSASVIFSISILAFVLVKSEFYYSKVENATLEIIKLEEQKDKIPIKHLEKLEKHWKNSKQHWIDEDTRIRGFSKKIFYLLGALLFITICRLISIYGNDFNSRNTKIGFGPKWKS